MNIYSIARTRGVRASVYGFVIASMVLGQFGLITPKTASATGAVCPAGDVKVNIGSGYEYSDGSGTITGNGTTVSWAAASGYAITSVCVKIGGPGGGSLVYPTVGAGSYTKTSYDISHAVLYTESNGQGGEDPVCDYTFDTDLYVMGEFCYEVTGDGWYQIQDSETVNVPVAGTYEVYAEVHRDTIDEDYGQDNEEFTMRVNGSSAGAVVLDQPPATAILTQLAGTFSFGAGNNTVYINTAYQCSPAYPNTLIRNSVDVKKLCLVKITPPRCGNEDVEEGEQCDLGDTTNNDGCSSTCQLETCGDGIQQSNEQCDEGDLNGTENHCNAQCTGTTTPYCGNEIEEVGEECDEGNLNGTANHCNSECTGTTTPYCGNDIVESGEQCDDGNAINDDGCSSSCQTEVPDESVTIVAHKIICTDEADVPNWGAGGPNITASTAADWVASHDSCSFAEGWNFQYAPDGTANPGDDLYGEANGAWTTFGSTNVGGMTTVSLDDLQPGKLWLREVLKDDYIPFTYGPNGNQNVDDYSAAFYCNNDVLNYDNYEWIQDPEEGETYHCVAWNVPDTKTICVTKYNDENEDGKVDDGDETLPGWDVTLTEHTNHTADCHENEPHNFFIAVISDLLDINNDDESCDEPVDETAGTGTTGEDGTYCFEVVGNGNYTVSETMQDGWHGIVETCDISVTADSDDYTCELFNAPDQECVEGPAWGYESVTSDQGTRKNGTAVLTERSNPDNALGAPDNIFYSLGVDGWLTLKFSSYIADTDGNDLSFHEVTNGRPGYPEETLSVEVSQDGTTWYGIGTVGNHDGGNGVGYLDFSSTGLAWIQYVKMTDATNYALHATDADGYDLDAVDATLLVCEPPIDPDEGSICGFKYHDEDESGTHTIDETKLASWSIDLKQDDSVIATTVTTENGYCFNDLPAGDYTVCETQQDGWTNSTPLCRDVTVAEDQSVTDITFGNYRPEPPREDGTITVCKYEDTDGNEAYSEGDALLPGWTISLGDGANEILNWSFETPIVTDSAQWDIYPSGTSGLGWIVEWFTNTTSYNSTSRPETANAELHSGVNAWIPQDGEQYAELDTDWDGPSGSLNGEPATVTMYQDIPTIPGQTYELSFWHSARPGTALGNNVMQVDWDGVAVAGPLSKDGSALSNTSWVKHTYTLTAVDSLTRLSFTDTGTADSLGNFLDNVTLKGPVQITGTGGCTTFTDLPFDTYTVYESVPAGWVQILPNDPNYHTVLLSVNNPDETVWFLNAEIDEPVDLCPNIDGVQETIPNGKYLDNEGQCVDIPIGGGTFCGDGIIQDPNDQDESEQCDDGNTVNGDGCNNQCVLEDICSNLEGVQTEVPEFHEIVEGQCVEIDVCSNIDGAQHTVPDGKILSDGLCIDEPVTDDICPNIEGDQASLPDGYQLIEEQCVEIDVCPNIDGAQHTVPDGKVLDDGQCVDAPTTRISTTGGGGGGGGGGFAALNVFNEKNEVILIPSTSISWFTNLNATCRAVYGTVSQDGSLTSDTNLGYQFSVNEQSGGGTYHTALLPNLQANTTYYWRPICDSGSLHKAGVQLSFATAGTPQVEGISFEPEDVKVLGFEFLPETGGSMADYYVATIAVFSSILAALFVAFKRRAIE